LNESPAGTADVEAADRPEASRRHAALGVIAASACFVQ
jgi:hypothetical protein